jgi:hypothetical protein
LSHLVTIDTKVHDFVAIAAACQRLHMPAPTQGTARLFSAEASGLLLQLPGWQYPAVIDTVAGTIAYDNFDGHWGNPVHLEKFAQMYAVEKAKIEARRRGHTTVETALADGSIRLKITDNH